MDNKQPHDRVTTATSGAWLLKQRDAGGFVGQLANAAAADRAFPQTDDVDAARKWLQASRAIGDDWEALEDSDMKWTCSAE